jgi:hypothetical protein
MDIKDAEGLFAEGPIRVCEVRTGGGESVIALQADELEEKDDYLEVLATAERLLDYINGALFLADMERRPLRVLSGGTVRERGETGIYDRQSVLVRVFDKLRARASISAVHITADGQSFVMEEAPRQPIEAEALALTTSDEAVREVLNYLRADPDHPALYSAYERIKRDVAEAQAHWQASGRNGARPGLPWAEGEDDEFRRSAQPFRHGDPVKWAGRNRDTAMRLPEARALVREWARKWLEWKQLNRSISPESPAPSSMPSSAARAVGRA